jgi:hypothetical protein
VAGFALRVVLISRGVRTAGIAIRFWDIMALSRDQQKLFPHFGETGTAIFAVKQVKNSGHDRTPSFDPWAKSCRAIVLASLRGLPK